MISGMFVVENIVSRQNAECQKKSIYILEVSKNIWVNPVFGLIEIRKLTMLRFYFLLLYANQPDRKI